jgi:multidrug transporter EmrE-like cation transporter
VEFILIKSNAFSGVIFPLIAAVGFSGKAILIKLAYLDHVDAITLLALCMVLAGVILISLDSNRPNLNLKS